MSTDTYTPTNDDYESLDVLYADQEEVLATEYTAQERRDLFGIYR